MFEITINFVNDIINEIEDNEIINKCIIKEKKIMARHLKAKINCLRRNALKNAQIMTLPCSVIVVCVQVLEIIHAHLNTDRQAQGQTVYLIILNALKISWFLLMNPMWQFRKYAVCLTATEQENKC